VRRAQLRALLIALLLIVCGISNLPFSRVTARDLDNPIAKAELERWSEILESVGVERPPKRLKQDTLTWGNRLADTKRSAMKPFRPVLRVTQTGQAWGLFTYPNTLPHTLHVNILVDGEWTPIYQAMDPEHDWMEARFRFRRVRGVYDDNAWQKRRSYENFVDWVAREALEDFEEAEAVQIYLVRSHARVPGEEFDPSEERRLVRKRTREDLL